MMSIQNNQPVLISNRINESGNVLFYILIAVALLAALSFAVTSGIQGSGSGDLSNERARLHASEIIEYAGNVSKAVAQLRLRGFSAEQISFENSVRSGLTNTGCTDDTCKIFHFSGGGITAQDAPNGASNSTVSLNVTGDMAIENIGTTCSNASCSDLLLVFDDLTLGVCNQLNELLGVSNAAPPTDSSLSIAAYTGSFTYSDTVADESGGSALDGQKSGCINDTGAGTYVFYKVLIAR